MRRPAKKSRYKKCKKFIQILFETVKTAKSGSYLRSAWYYINNINRKSSAISVKVSGQPISIILSRLIGIAWFFEKLRINVKFNFVDCSDLFENSTLIFSEKHQNGNQITACNSLSIPSFFINYAKSKVSSEWAYEIISRLKIKKEIQQQVDEFINSNLRGDWVGIHIRGTDVSHFRRKYRRLEIEDYITYIREVLEHRYKIFLCSDQTQFIERIHAAFPGRVFSRDILRSSDKTPLHRASKYAGHQQKRDAFIDFLVLAKASLVYTSGSYFVDTVRFFNPSIRIISLDGRQICYKNIPNYTPPPKLQFLHFLRDRKNILHKPHKFRLNFKTLIWASYVLFRLILFTVRFYKLKIFTLKEKRESQSMSIKVLFDSIKRDFNCFTKFVKCYGLIIGAKSSLISVQLKSRSISTIFFDIIGIAWFCDKMRINIRFNFLNDDKLFENARLMLSEESISNSRKPIKLKSIKLLTNYARFAISSDYGHKIISKLIIEKGLKQQADEWIATNLRGDWLGIHYRGTDVRETLSYRFVDIEDYITYLKEMLNNDCKIFACSDQSQFIDRIHTAFPGRVCSRNITRSDDNNPLHIDHKYSGRQQQQDALIDLLVLSQASLVYTTGSYFADITRFLNPSIKIISVDGRKKCYKNIPNYLANPKVPC